MNKYELKYLLETLISSNDRLTDVAGKQTTHIAELWTEIGLKNEKITKLTSKIYELQDVIKSQRTKDHTLYIWIDKKSQSGITLTRDIDTKCGSKLQKYNL